MVIIIWAASPLQPKTEPSIQTKFGFLFELNMCSTSRLTSAMLHPSLSVKGPDLGIVEPDALSSLGHRQTLANKRSQQQAC